MTTLVAYLSVDDIGPSAITLISDSRITWADASNNIAAEFSHSQKLFYLHRSPTIFGYCGDSLFSLAAISQISTALDLSTDFIRSECMLEKARMVQEMLSSAAGGYPKASDLSRTSLIQVTRIGPEFFAHEFCYNSSSQEFEGRDVPLHTDQKSHFVSAWGSGQHRFREIAEYMKDKNGDHARSFFRSLVLQLKYERDRFSGGAPQMVVLGREKLPIPVGVRYQGSTYLLGLPYTAGHPLENVEFRNESYEFVDYEGTRRSHSQKHGYKDWRPEAKKDIEGDV